MNTESIANFFDGECVALLEMAEGEAVTDSLQGLNAFALFKKYTTVIDGITRGFLALQEEKQRGTSAEQVAEAVLTDRNNPASSGSFLCTEYIVGALDFDAFRQLAVDMKRMLEYSDDDLEDD